MKIMNKKKFLPILLSLIAILGLCACKSKIDTTSEVPSMSEVTLDTSHYELTERTESVSEEEYFPFEASTEKSHELIREIIAYHGYYKGSREDKVDELFGELEKENQREAKLWHDIVDYWDYANNEMPVNLNQLPDNLPDDDSLCIMILGFELNDDGSMQQELIGRLNVALTCANQYPNAPVVCTGGGTAIHNPSVTEAGLMGDWLVEHGLDESRLIIENKSQTTAENAIFSYGILREKYPNVNSVALISSSYHIPWGALLLEAAFMKTASDGQCEEMHVVSNAAYEFSNPKYADVPRFETGGLLQLIGEESLAMKYYMNTQTAP